MRKIKAFNLDEYRLVMAFLIIAIHIYPFVSLNETIDFLFTHVFARIAVPFFFLMTGFFLLPKVVSNREKLACYTKSTLKLYFFCILLYLPINLYAHHFQGIDGLGIVKMIFIDGTMYHLWYFPALILGLWLCFILFSKKNSRYWMILFFILYLIGLFGDSYYGIIENSQILKEFYGLLFHVFSYTRNGLFYAPIFLAMGYSIKERENDKSLVNKKYHFFIFLFCLFLMMIEGWLLHQAKVQRHDSMYLFLLPTMYFLFSYLTTFTRKTRNILARNMATTIYIMHPFFIVIIRLVAKFLHLTSILIDNSLIHYISVSIATFLFAYFLEKIKQKLSTYDKNNKK